MSVAAKGVLVVILSSLRSTWLWQAFVSSSVLPSWAFGSQGPCRRSGGIVVVMGGRVVVAKG